MYKYNVKIQKVSGRLNESAMPSKNLIVKSKTKKTDKEVFAEASKYFKKKYCLVIESADISSEFFRPKKDMKTSISKYTARKIERILNELLAEDEFDSLIVEIKSSEYMGDVQERECVDISWLDYKNRGRDFVQSAIYKVLDEEEEDFDKGWILYTSDYDTYMPIIERELDGTHRWRIFRSWLDDIEYANETKFDCTCHSWMIAIDDED